MAKRKQKMTISQVDSTQLMTMAEKIRILRECSGFTQTELGIHVFGKEKGAHNKIRNLEWPLTKTSRQPKIWELQKIAKKLQVRFTDFMNSHLEPELLSRLEKTYPIKK